jgi:hypothetical protein
LKRAGFGKFSDRAAVGSICKKSGISGQSNDFVLFLELKSKTIGTSLSFNTQESRFFKSDFFVHRFSNSGSAKVFLKRARTRLKFFSTNLL